MVSLTAKWAATREQMRRRWPALTEDDLDAAAESPQALAALLELRLGYGPAAAEAEAERALRELAHEAPSTAAEPPPGKSRGWLHRLMPWRH